MNDQRWANLFDEHYNKEFDSSWFEDLVRIIPASGPQTSGLTIRKTNATVCLIDLGNPLHTEQMQTLFRYWLNDPELYNNTKSGLRYYVGPRSI